MYKVWQTGIIISCKETDRKGQPIDPNILMRVVYHENPHKVLLGCRMLETT